MTVAEKVEFRKMKEQNEALKELVKIMKDGLICSRKALEAVSNEQEEKITELEMEMTLNECENTMLEVEKRLKQWYKDAPRIEIGRG